MTVNNSIRMVYLDMGHVITMAPSRKNWEALIDAIGLPAEEFLSRYREHRDAYDKGIMKTEVFWSLVVNGGAGELLQAEQMEALLRADTTCWADYDERMITWADSLRKEGYITGILSNMPLFYADFVRGKDWFNRFSHHVLSAEVKQLKPEPEIYESAISECGYPAHEILFIDDLPANVAGASRAGMQALRFTGVENLHTEVTERYGLPPIL